MTIKTWACESTRELFERERNRVVPPQVAKRARMKLTMVNAAAELDFLRVPPANNLEKLKGDRAGQWSIRINKKYRVCFKFRSGDAFDVEIIDYH